MFVVDTNVLIYAADVASTPHTRCRELLVRWRAQPTPWYLTWGIIYEFMRVTTHPRVLRTPWTLNQAWSFVEAVLASSSVGVLAPTERHSAIAASTISELPHLAGNIVHDLHTAVLMREHGVSRIITRDSDFHRFPFVDVTDPLA